MLESYVTKTRDKAAALSFIKRDLKRHGRPKAIVTDGLRSYTAALKDIALTTARRWVAGPTTGPRTHTIRSDDEKGRC